MQGVQKVPGYAMLGGGILEIVTDSYKGESKLRAVANPYGKLIFYGVKPDKSGTKFNFKQKAECSINFNVESILCTPGVDCNYAIVIAGKTDNKNSKFLIVKQDGTVLKEQPIHEMGILHAAVSADTHWISICGGMSNATLYHITTTREGKYRECQRALNLRHKSTVTSANFNREATKVVTTCKDGFARCFNIDVGDDFFMSRGVGDDAKLLFELNYGSPCDFAALSKKHLCVMNGTEMKIYSAASLLENASEPKVLDTVENVQHFQGSRVTTAEYSADESQIIIGGSDKHAYIYNLPEC